MYDNHGNFGYSTVAVAPSPATSGVSLTVQSGDGATFPTPPFNATLKPFNAIPTFSIAEIVRVTAITGDVLTITRSQESSTAQNVLVGWQIAATITKKIVIDVESAITSETTRATAAEVLLAPKASPALTGVPTAPTATSGTNTTQLATTAYVEGEIVANATPNATASVIGKVQLAADLSGSATAPTVVGTHLASPLPLLQGGSGASTDKAGFYSPADFVLAPSGSGYKADSYTSGTNDHVQINNAITAAAALPNGGTVLLRTGTYTIGAPIVLPNNVTLRGMSYSSTRITTVANASFSIFDNYNNFSPSAPWTNFTVAKLELDGSNMNPAVASKGMNGRCVLNGKFIDLYIHDCTATGLGVDDYASVEVRGVIANNNGYTNKKAITAISWNANVLTITVPSHGLTAGTSKTVVTGCVPLQFNDIYTVTTVIDTDNFTIAASNNSGWLSSAINPGTATTLGFISDSLIGHNGIGIASGAMTIESMVVANCFANGNQNNNFLVEGDTATTGPNCAYQFSNCVSYGAGDAGFLNTGTPNVQYINCFDYGSPTSYIANPTQVQKTITAISWSAGVATYTTSTAHGYAIGYQVNIQGNTPNGYNGFQYVTGVTSTTFTTAIASDPGTATVFGNSQYTQHPVSGTSYVSCMSVNSINYAMKFPSATSGIIIDNCDLKFGYNYGVYLTSSHTIVQGSRIHGFGQQAIHLVTGSTSVPMSHIEIGGNEVYNNGTAYANRDGIDISSNAASAISNVSIHNNHCFDSQQTQTQRYGVTVFSGGANSNIYINDNDLTGNTTAALLIQDTSNTIYAHNNIGANPVGKYEFGTITTSITIDCKVADFHTFTLGNSGRTISFNSGLVKGTKITVGVGQDATGSRTITAWSGLIVWANGGSAPVLSTAANAMDFFTFIWNGTNWLQTVPSTLSYIPTTAIVNGGTGQTTQQAAINALTGTQSSGKYLRSDGTNSTIASIQAADVPTLNQNTSGSAATLATPRAIYGNTFDGSAAITAIITSVYGGTGNGFAKFSGPASTEKTFTLPNATATILTDNAAVTVAQGGTGATTLTGILKGNGTSAVTAVTAPSGAIVGDTDTQTLTNKRNTARVVSTASSSTPTPNGDTTDQYEVTALAVGATFGAPTGTPTDGQKLIIRIKDNGTAQTLAWNAIYVNSGLGSLPATTVISKTHLIALVYDSTAVAWACVVGDAVGY